MPHRLVVVGAGASGAATVIETIEHLTEVAKESSDRSSIDITVVESRPHEEFLWKGAAYSAKEDCHVLNVTRGQMSIAIGDFDTFVKSNPKVSEEDRLQFGTEEVTHVPRRLFGNFLVHRATEAIELGQKNGVVSSFQAVHGEAIGHRRSSSSNAEWSLVVACHGAEEEHKEIPYDSLVLATGNGTPFDPLLQSSSGSLDPTRYISNSWERIRQGPLNVAPSTAPVAIFGSRLSAVDIILMLHDEGHKGPMHVYSREGLFPGSNIAGEVPSPVYPSNLLREYLDERGVPSDPADFTVGPDEGYPSVKIDEVAAIVMEEVEKNRKLKAGEGFPWQSVTDSIRPDQNRLWAALTPSERAIFLARYRGLWETARHRVARFAGRTLHHLIDQGQVVNHRIARIVRVSPVGGGSEQEAGLRVTVIPAKSKSDSEEASKVVGQSEEEEHIDAAYVFNCIGPSNDYRPNSQWMENGMIKDLAKQGLIYPEPNGMGVFTHLRSGAMLIHPQRTDTETMASSSVRYAVGPIRRGSEWECVAVRDIVVNAKQVAKDIGSRVIG